MLSVKVRQRAKGGYPQAMLACQPQQDIHVMAAFLQDHGRAFSGVAPIAAHKGVRLVPVADVLVCTDGDDIADLFAVENGL